MPVQENDYAVVIGIEHYVSSDLQTLTHAIHDAEEVKNWLLDQTTGGGLPSENCKPIFSSKGSDHPVNDDVDAAFESIFKLAKKRRPIHARRLYFYFSGHGMSSSMIQAYLCLPKWSTRWRTKTIDSLEYWQMLADTGYFSEIVCLFDCCRTFLPNIGGPTGLRTMAPAEDAATAKSFTGFAAEYLKEAFEERDDGGHSFFTRALLTALKGGACQATGGATPERLSKFLKSETSRLAKLDGKTQNPRITNDFDPEDGCVFGSALPVGSASSVKQAYEVEISDPADSSVVLVDGNSQETPWDKSQPWRIEVGEGLHVLERKSTGKMLRLPRDVTKGVFHVDF